MKWMTSPDFSKKTIETLAKRAAYHCSNPDCRVITVGPNSDPNKSIVIGEAAHIQGARTTSKRFNIDMTNFSRGEITNGIWLCRNCHKLIDSDENLYTSNILFSWREQHEKYVLSDLGNNTQKTQYRELQETLIEFENYPPLIRRIVIDKPDGWEWRLTAELMRYLNKPAFRKLQDLRDSLYIKSRDVLSEEEVFEWIRGRVGEMSRIIEPFMNLIQRLNDSWGKPGEAGDINEIHHICCLIRDNLEEVIKFEEKLFFVIVPENTENIVALLKNCIGSQVEKLQTIPESLDEVIALIKTENEGTAESPVVIQKEITFDLPEGWEKNFNKELKKIKYDNFSEETGCMPIATFIVIIVTALILFL